MTIPGNADSATAFARRSLEAHGWVPQNPPMPRYGGLQYGAPRNQSPTMFCKPGSPEMMNVTWQFHGQSTLLRLTRSLGGICGDAQQGQIQRSSSTLFISRGEPVGAIDPRMAESPFATLPPLWAPTDFRASQVCRPANGGNAESSQDQPLRTDLSLSEILAHYGRQLDSAGWKSMAAGNLESKSASWWNESKGTQVTLTVTKLAAPTGCYDVSLRPTRRRTTR